MAGSRQPVGLNFISHMCCGGVVLDKLDHECRIVLIEVDKGRRPQWLLPKGHVEAGEPYEDAARREVSEETGIVSVAIDGNLIRNVSEAQLRRHLTTALVEVTPVLEKLGKLAPTETKKDIAES